MNTKDENDLNHFLEKNQEALLEYFKKKVWNYADAQDLAQDTLTKFYEYCKEQRKVTKPVNLLNKIKKRVLIDYYRKQQKERKRYVDIDNIEDECAFRGEVEFIKEIERKSFNEKQRIWLFRKVLLTKFRSLQGVILISKAPLCKELKQKIKLMYPFTAKRFKERGLYFEVVYKNEKITNAQLNEMYCGFGVFLENLAERFGVNDWIGKNALKVLLLAQDPWLHWLRLAGNKKKRVYKSLDEKGKLVNKKFIDRPYLYFFRDFIGLEYGNDYSETARLLEEFVKFEKEKYPDIKNLMVSELEKIEIRGRSLDRYIRKRYGLDKIDRDILKKQISGRLNSTGLKGKINNYNHLIKDILKEI